MANNLLVVPRRLHNVRILPVLWPPYTPAAHGHCEEDDAPAHDGHGTEDLALDLAVFGLLLTVGEEVVEVLVQDADVVLVGVGGRTGIMLASKKREFFFLN